MVCSRVIFALSSEFPELKEVTRMLGLAEDLMRLFSVIDAHKVRVHGA